MSDLPNLDRLARKGADNLTARELQTLCIRADHTVPPGESDAKVPPLLAHIDELCGQIENLRKSVDATKQQVLAEEIALVRTESVETFVRGRLEHRQFDATQTQEDDWRIAARINWNQKHPVLADLLKKRGVR